MSRTLSLAGGAAAVLALLAALLDPARALPGWLVAFAFWSGVPVGALFLLMLMRILPGPWSVLAPATSVAALLMPLAVLAALPVALGLATLYPWSAGDLGTAFRSGYLSGWFAGLRSGIFFAGCIVLAILLSLPRPGTRALATGALVVFVPFHSLIAVDWLMSLDPAFHSSVFGLYVLSIQATTALSALLIVRLVNLPAGHDPRPLGAILLTALLLWVYFAYMQYLISWSDNLPASAAWYGRRSEGGWALVFPAVVLLHAVPTAFLLFPPFRVSRTALIGFCVAILVGKALETAWLVLPEFPAGSITILTTLLALAGLGGLGLAAAPLAARLRDAGDRRHARP